MRRKARKAKVLMLVCSGGQLPDLPETYSNIEIYSCLSALGDNYQTDLNGYIITWMLQQILCSQINSNLQ